MKIAISADGKTLDSNIDPRFGRCNYFLIIEIEDQKIKDFRAIENIAKDQMGGAGVTAGETIAREKVDAVITVNVGPRAYSVFEQFGVKIYQAEGKIKEAVENFLMNRLVELSDSNGQQHAGIK